MVKTVAYIILSHCCDTSPVICLLTPDTIKIFTRIKTYSLYNEVVIKGK